MTQLPPLVCDIASYQPADLAFFQALKAQNIKAVIVKLTEGSSPGTAYVNPKAKLQILNARACGLLVHGYHYARFSGQQDATNEANWFIQNAKQLGLTASSVLALDIESTEHAFDVTAEANQFLKTLKDNGYPHVDFYTMASWFWNGRVNPQKLIAKNLWIANYNVTAPGVDHVGTWQFTSRYLVNQIKVDMSYDFKHFYTSPLTSSTPKVWIDELGDQWTLKSGIYTVKALTPLRFGAKANSTPIATLYPGDQIKYDATSQHDGQIWLRQPRGDTFGYLAIT